MVLELFACLETCFTDVSWEKFLKSAQCIPLTLIHGDFHALNTMWTDKSSKKIKLFDWEFVFWGPGHLDLGYYFLAPVDLRDSQKDEHLRLVRAYYDELIRCNPRAGTDGFWNEFVYGGLDG